MRKVVGLLVGLAVLGLSGSALAGQAVTDGNGDFIDLSVRATPPVSGTAKAPRAVGVTFNSFTGNRINANNTLNNNSLKVHFAQNFTSNGLLFPACTLNTTGPSSCPAASKVGSGTAEGELLGANGAPPTYVAATLAVYNGKPSGGKNPTEIFVGSVGGKPAVELDFTVSREAGGLSFTEIHTPGPPSGQTIYLTKFSVTIPARSEMKTIKGKRRKIDLLDAPTSCHGAWTYSQTLGFTTQPPLTATDSQPCVKG